MSVFPVASVGTIMSSVIKEVGMCMSIHWQLLLQQYLLYTSKEYSYVSLPPFQPKAGPGWKQGQREIIKHIRNVESIINEKSASCKGSKEC